MADNQGREIPRRQVLEEYDAWLGVKPRPPAPRPPEWRAWIPYLLMGVVALAVVIRWS